MVASIEYLERAWTLAERMARYGHKERLCRWMSLEAWMGIVLDTVIKGILMHLNVIRCYIIDVLKTFCWG